MQDRFKAISCLLSLVGVFAVSAARAQVADPSAAQPSRLTQPINEAQRVTLKGHVLRGLTPDMDLGLVEDSMPVHLFLNLRRTPAQQADLDALLAAQQNPKSPAYHKWLTPEQFGARFGASDSDIQKTQEWLEAQGFEVVGVAKNKSVINLKTTAAGVREAFQAQLHYANIHGGKHFVTANEPTIPAAFSSLISGISGLNEITPREHHTPIHTERYDADTHKWLPVSSNGTDAAGAQPHYLDPGTGHYNVTPQDYYTIYNINPTLKAGNVGGAATIGILGSGPFDYGTVTNGKAAGGDVTTFRNLFGITTPLNLKIESGDANFPCIVASGSDSGESALDVEWAGATAPGATLIFESCAGSSDGSGFDFLTETQALVDANVADIITSSIGFTEGALAGTQAFETAFAQGAAQGQTFLSAQGDSGWDDADFGAPQGISGLNIDYPGSSTLVLSVGGTDFQDLYDVDAGSSIPQSTYWSATNSQFYGNALGYVPETTWNDSCASPLVATTTENGGAPGETTATYCNSPVFASQRAGGGGGGGISTLFAQPSWQTGIPGLSASITKRVTPDISMFSSPGQYWGHSLAVCDTGGGQPCSAGSFGFSGGTSFAAPSLAGILGLLKTSTGSRQGLVQPALYALAKAQYSAGTACYANGQTANTGITTGLPASSCVFNDVTTNGNDNECQAGSTDCFSNPGASYGVLTASPNTSVFIDAYAAGAQYDIATGLGSLNVTNLLAKWNTAFTSSTTLKANPTSITAAQTTSLTATVTGGQPPNAGSPAPALTGSITFKAGGVTVGTCMLVSGSCSANVQGSALQPGANSITATFAGSQSYPSSTSSVVTVTVTSTTTNQTITFAALPNVTYGVNPIALTATASSGLPVTYKVTGPATLSGSTLSIIGAGSVMVTASQAGNSSFTAATPVTRTFTVAPATLTATAANLSRAVGAANPTLTYAVTGFVHGDSSAVVTGTATLTTTATTSSPAGPYPITFATRNLAATNYTINYVSGTLTVTGAATGNFTITPLPATETIKRGYVAAFVLQLKSVNGFNGNVTLSCMGTPAGSKCVDFPQTVKVNGVAYAISGILFPKTTPAGTYVVTFMGVSGTLTHKATATFIVK